MVAFDDESVEVVGVGGGRPRLFRATESPVIYAATWVFRYCCGLRAGLIAQRGMDSLMIVEDLDVMCNVVGCLLPRRVDGAVDTFDFERGIE